MSYQRIIFMIVGGLIAGIAIEQIGVCFYQVGCFKRYNQFIDSILRWFESDEWDELFESICELGAIAVGIFLIAIFF